MNLIACTLTQKLRENLDKLSKDVSSNFSEIAIKLDTVNASLFGAEYDKC